MGSGEMAADREDVGASAWFWRKVGQLSERDEGVRDLVQILSAAGDAERSEILADLYELVEDHEAAGVGDLEPGGREILDCEAIAEERRALRRRLSAIVEERGGVAEVARSAGIPRRALERMTVGMAEAQAGTLRRLGVGFGAW